MKPDEKPEAFRLRTPPAERFAGPAHFFSLREILADLRKESHPARKGHHQVTLFRRGPMAYMAFVFDEDGHLDRHSAPGPVTIQAIDGHLAVMADGQEYDLKAGDVLILDTAVPHGVRALEPSAMLLGVCLDK